MTLAEIVADCQGAYGARYQCSSAKILQFINTIQQVAYNRDLLAFLWWEDFLTVFQEVTFSSVTLPFVAADVGKVITDGSVTGTLRSFDNSKGTAQIETTGTFSGTLNVTSGTAVAAVFESQAVSKGPYSWASLVPSLGSLTGYTTNGGVRRMIGLTRLTDQQLFNTIPPRALTDYGFNANLPSDRYFLENVRKYDMQKALKFIDTPDTAAETYRWIYFMRPPTVSGATAADDVNLVIPPEFHETVVKEGVGLLADRSVYGDKTPESVLEVILTPFWNAMQQPYLGMGSNANMTSEGTL